MFINDVCTYVLVCVCVRASEGGGRVRVCKCLHTCLSVCIAVCERWCVIAYVSVCLGMCMCFRA